MRRRMVCLTGLLLVGLLVTACGAAPAGPMTWLDRPLDGSELPLAPVTILAHASDEDGVASFEFFIDDAPLSTAPAGGGRLGRATVDWNPTEAGIYTVRARGIDNQGNVGGDATSVVRVGEVLEVSPTVPSEPGEGEVIFVVEPSAIAAGECAKLRWEVQPPGDALLDGETVPSQGEREVCPEETTVYELLVPDRDQVHTVTLHVEREGEPPPAGELGISFTADRTNLGPDECTTLRWSVQGGLGVELDGQPVDPTGEREVCPAATTTYRLGVDTGEAIDQREVVIVVGGASQPTSQPEATATSVPTTAPPVATTPPSGPTPTQPAGCPGPPMISSFTASPNTIAAGQSTTLSWGRVTNGNSDQLVRSVVINPGLGEVGSPGSRVVSPASTTTYTLVANGCGGTAQRQVTVTVNPAAFSADLAITDLYPQTNYGPVWVRITNHGTGTVNNVTVQVSCQWTRTVLQRPAGTGQQGPIPISIGNLIPGQTQAFDTDILVDLYEYGYNMTCTIQVPFNDPNTDNNSYSESFAQQSS